MRILFVTPYPPSRIRVRGYGFLMQLQKNHEITVLTQWTSTQERADVETLRGQGYDVVAVQEPKRDVLLRSGIGLVRSHPLQVAYARSKRFIQAMQDLCEQRSFDVVHVEHLRGVASMEQFSSRYPMVWDAVDCISLLCKHTIVAGPTLSVRTVARFEHERTRRYEARMLHHPFQVIVTSERDRQAMIDLHRTTMTHQTRSEELSGKTITVLPNGVDLEYFHPMRHKRNRFNVVFSGKMSYHANVATALYLYRHIMPLIWQKRPEATLTIVGSKPPQELRRLARDSRVEVTGFVEDMRPYISRADVMLSPMVYSVGIQNKVLEAMALGTPVVVSGQVAAALNTQVGRDVLVAETAQEFADATLRLMDDAELHTTLSQSGWNYVKQHHEWSAVVDRLVAVYQQAIATHAEAHHAADIANIADTADTRSLLLPSITY